MSKKVDKSEGSLDANISSVDISESNSDEANVKNKTIDKLAKILGQKVNKKSKKKSKFEMHYRDKYNFYWNKYIEDLNLKRANIDVSAWGRSQKIKKLKKKTGIDYRECHNLDNSIALYVYSRLKCYKEYTIADLEYEAKDYGDFHGTLKEAIDIVLKGLKLYLKRDEYSVDKYMKKCQKYLQYEEVEDNFNYMAAGLVYSKAMKTLADIGPALWD